MEWSYTLYENMRLCRSNHVLSSFYDILTGKVGVLVSAGTELTFFLVAGTVLCFGFSVRMMLITL